MTNQIFKNILPIEILIDLLKDICSKINDYYTIDINSYKRGIFTNKINEFLEKCKPYYHKSKHKYLERKLTYNNFVTVVRQICNQNKIAYTSKIKYDKSDYNIIYNIYL